jgi:hypothetical protein
MFRWSNRALTALLAILVVAVAASGAGARVPLARSAATCHLSNSRSYGYTYLTWLWVNRTSCGVGAAVARHHGHQRGWRCTRKVLARSPVQYQAKETCTGGQRTVAWTFTQNT